MKNKMKSIKFLVLLFSLGIFITSCENDEEIFTATTTDPITLFDLPITTISLDPSTPGNPAVTFNWEEADYGQPASENYRVELSIDEAFTSPVLVSSVNGTTATTLTVSELNTGVGNAGLPPFQNGTIYVRVLTSIGTQNGLPQSSNTISFTVFPYTTIKPQLFLVGAYQSVSGYGTENAEAPTLASSEFGTENDYDGFVYFGGSDLSFQFHRAGFVGDYVEGNPIYGNDGGNAVEGASGSFEAPSEGFYRVNVDLETGTVSFTETNWGIAGPGGPAGDWPGDTVDDADMTYNIEAKVWEFNNASTASGEFKYRANDDWGLNFGLDSDNDGSLNFGGDNFSNEISATKFILDLSEPRAYSQSIISE
ncbi:MAG: SusE domain-containing protein [Bacteroidota bacterium]